MGPKFEGALTLAPGHFWHPIWAHLIEHDLLHSQYEEKYFCPYPIPGAPQWDPEMVLLNYANIV